VTENDNLETQTKIIQRLIHKIEVFPNLPIPAKSDTHFNPCRTVFPERSDERVYLTELLSLVNSDFSLRIEGPLISIV
jgi:hypothetical protein